MIRLTYAVVDLYCASYPRPPRAVTLDIDDTVDVVHGHQQLSLFSAHYDERCFLPIHVYDTATSRPVAVLLRPGATPSGAEIRNHLRRLVRRIRQHWPHTRLTIRGDGHYGRPEVMAFCEDHGVDYILGLPGNKVLDRLVEQTADDVRVRRAEEQAVVLQVPQEPTGLRPHQLPLATRKPGAACAAHRGVLADARVARRDPGSASARPRGVHYLADAADQDRRTDPRDRQPDPDRLRGRPSRGGAVASLARCLQPAGP